MGGEEVVCCGKVVINDGTLHNTLYTEEQGRDLSSEN